jgi:hypothetical protein
LKSNPLPHPLIKGQIWKTKDNGYISIVSVGKVLIHYRHSLKPLEKGSPLQRGVFVQMEARRTVESFLKRKHARLVKKADPVVAA